ncbi:MAG: hypothetical protein N2037_04430 [Acidimicrobiales bacterium]|nr:hypothetical protein [Acidimicrobiales bacterium]
MGPVQLFFNPHCSKARSARSLLDERGVDYELVEYLKNPPSRDQIEHLLAILEDPPEKLVRKDNRFKELGLDPSDYNDRGAIAALLVEHPELMERPVVVVGDRAVIGRPPERVLELL